MILISIIIITLIYLISNIIYEMSVDKQFIVKKRLKYDKVIIREQIITDYLDEFDDNLSDEEQMIKFNKMRAKHNKTYGEN